MVNLTEELKLKEYWDKGITGEGVKIAIFDTGISDIYHETNKENIKENINLSGETYAAGTDFSGHGTFVSSVFFLLDIKAYNVTKIITSSNKECPGIAPDADIYIFKVFTKTEGIVI